MKRYTIEELKARFAALGLKWHNFHLIGIRSRAYKPDVFDDQIYVVDGLRTYCYAATTNPGRYWLSNLANPKGAAVVKSDAQYPNVWALGYHKGERALVQVGPITVFRDNDKDEKAEEQGELETGYFGINCHNANDNAISIIVGKWSAGCQVVPDPKNHAEILRLCAATEMKAFTYSLLKEF